MHIYELRDTNVSMPVARLGTVYIKEEICWEQVYPDANGIKMSIRPHFAVWESAALGEVWIAVWHGWPVII